MEEKQELESENKNEKKSNKKKIFLIIIAIIFLDIIVRYAVFNFIDGQSIYFRDDFGIIYNRYFPWNHERYEKLKYMYYNVPSDYDGPIAAKPIIYIYPEKEMELTIKLGMKDNITCSYPKYQDGWNVIAYPDGTLIDKENNKKLYALYWEGRRKKEIPMNDGFVVKGEDSAKFLEEKLAILGLNEKESEEFIIYWLPKLESNKYNLIRFETMNEIEQNMPIEIYQEPDTLIRVWMQFKGLETSIEIPEQYLETNGRVGFTLVEWGGTEIK